MRALRLRRGDKGGIFLELFLVVGVLGIVAVAVLAGVTRNYLVPDRKEATAGTAARDYAEAIRNMVASGGYVECGTADTYSTPPGFAPPSGYVASVVAGSMEYWNGAGWQPTCSPDTGLQRLTVQVRSTDKMVSREVSVELRRT